MAQNPATKLREVVNVKTGVRIYRFPENIGSTTAEPESRKFCLFRFHNVDDSGNPGETSTCVVLPFPEINDAINIKYENVEFDVVGAIAVGASAGNVSIDRLSDIAKTGLKSFNRDSFARIATDVVLSGPPGLKAGVAKGLNTVQNPYISNVFNSSVNIFVNLIIILYKLGMELYRKFLGLVELLDFVFQVV